MKRRTKVVVGRSIFVEATYEIGDCTGEVVVCHDW
ncbi:MAG: hypothetical protein RL532_1115, partial [Actinomycetota bacterium]